MRNRNWNRRHVSEYSSKKSSDSDTEVPYQESSGDDLQGAEEQSVRLEIRIPSYTPDEQHESSDEEMIEEESVAVVRPRRQRRIISDSAGEDSSNSDLEVPHVESSG